MTEPPATGDARAECFEALFARHYGAVRAYARRRADPETAQDAVADTFLVAWRRLEDLPGDPLPFLFGTCRKALADQRRAGRRRTALADRAGAEAARAPQPDGPAERVGEADATRRALARLSETDRETLMLVAWEGYDPADAAAAAGCSRATFAVRLHRARRRLETALQEEDR